MPCRSSCTTTSATRGHGYPFGLRANEIPLGARIVAVADAYDAMIHDRPYKRAMSHDAAIAELRRHAGTQFDPELVESFCDLYANEPPAPDPAVLAMIAGAAGHGGRHGANDGPAIMVPERCPGDRCAVAAGPTRSRHHRPWVPMASWTSRRACPSRAPRARRLPATAPTGSLTSLPTPGSPRTGRSESESATR